jgi:flagellar biosynthesis protein FlhF
MKQKIIAMVGPTGVGKTTTIAKIAANMALKMHKKVCLISIDTFRIGAVEQLKTYAEIVDVPLEVASSPEELKEIIIKCKDYDYILLDSMGRSQFDKTQIKDLEAFLNVSTLISVVLVLSMSSNHSEILDTYERYSSLKPEYVIFTKMDETKKFGPVVNLPIVKKIPLLLFTTGQNVPDDMEVPDGKKIARKVLSEIPTLWSE